MKTLGSERGKLGVSRGLRKSFISIQRVTGRFRRGYSKKVTFKLTIRRSGGTAFQEKGIASAKTLR